MGGLSSLAAQQALVSAPLAPATTGILRFVPSAWRLILVTTASLFITLALLPALEAVGIGVGSLALPSRVDHV